MRLVAVVIGALLVGAWLGALGAGSAGSVLAQDATAIERQPVEVELFDVRSVVPADWRDMGTGIFARGVPPEDQTLIALQSAQVPVADVWPSLLPQLALAEVPPRAGERATEAFTWTLYEVDIDLPQLSLAVDLALAERDRHAYLVLMQSAPRDRDALYKQVFLPAVDAFAVLEPTPTPAPDTLGYQVEEVSFPGGSPDVTLAGTLTLPTGPGPHPVVALLSGSGAQDRDESLKPVTTLKPFALIADALTRAGVGVLRYDDRGVGGSTGSYPTATIADLTADARSAIDFLAGRSDVDASRIGILGHSEGSIYAASLAADDPRVAFVVGMAPPSIDGVSLIVAQTEALARASGEPEEEVGYGVALAETLYPLILAGDDAAAEDALRDALGAAWDRQPDDAKAVLGDRDGFVGRQVDVQLPTLTSEWFRSLLASDPAADWARVQSPALGLFGRLDAQVPLEANEPAWREALAVAGNADATSVILDDANHLFQAARTGSLGEYATLDPEFTPDFLPTLVAWVTARAGVDG
jgi:dienelactone hydrolase